MKPLVLSEADASDLKEVVRRPSSSSQSVMRTKRILLAAQAWPNNKIAEEVAPCAHTVGKWRRRFIEFGIWGVGDLPRPKALMRTGDHDVARLIRNTLQTTPVGRQALPDLPPLARQH
ncbi:MAG: hypothetical protein GY946_22735 [bacterium]|nr:hypothetical protein [bacterium]